MKQVKLDGKRLQTREELHDFLQSELDLPAYYGRNLDALWDSLTGFVTLPLLVEWYHFEESKQRWGEYAQQVADVFQQAAEKMTEFHFLFK